MSFRIVRLAAIAVAGSLHAFVAEAQPPNLDDKVEKVVIEKVESKYKLPPSSEARWLEKKREFFELNRKTMRLAYDEVGKRDPKWDDAARMAIDLTTRILTDQVQPTTMHWEAFEYAKRAMAAGCDDPLVLYAYAFCTGGRRNFSGDEYAQRSEVAAEAIRKSPYSPMRRSMILANAARSLSRKIDSDASKAKGLQFAEDALVAFGHSLRQERELFAPSQFRHHAETLVDIFKLHHKDWKSAYDHVDRIFVPLKDAQVVRLQARSHFLYHWAWQARGADFAGGVEQNDANRFRERMDEMRKTLLEAWNLQPTPVDADTPTMMIYCLKAIGSDDFENDVKLWFDRAMSIDPDNELVCEEMIDLLDPKWHGSNPQMLAFARECGKSANVYNRIALLLADAHARATIRLEQRVMQKYLRSKAVRKEIDDAFVKYFTAVPGDRTQKSRYAMHVFYTGYFHEAATLFDQGDNFFRPMSLYRMPMMEYARDTAKRYNSSDSIITLSRFATFRRWETLARVPDAKDKSGDRVLSEWLIQQGGTSAFSVGKKRIVAKAIADLPQEPFEVDVAHVEGRIVPIEMPTIAKCDKLRSLSFTRFDLRVGEMKRLGEFPGVKTLLCTISPTTDDAVAAELIRHFPKMDALILDDTAVTDEFVSQLARPNLQVIGLAGTKVTDKAIDALAKMKGLKRVRLDRTAITEEALDRLQAALPQLAIGYEDGAVRRK
jgi:hypothetical protein